MTNREYIILMVKGFICGGNSAAMDKVTEKDLEYEKHDPRIVYDYSPPEDHLASKLYGHVTFYRVGRNASHEFYLGFDAQDNAYSYSCGESYGDDEKSAAEIVASRYRKIDNLQGRNLYVGHY